MTTPFTLNTDRRDDGRLVVIATGEIDLSNTQTFSKHLVDAIAESGNERVNVDLSGVEFLDSGAINVLFRYADHVQLIVNALLLPVLSISGLTELVPVEQG